MRIWQAHASRADVLAFSPDGRVLVSGAGRDIAARPRSESSLAVWDALGGKLGEVAPPVWLQPPGSDGPPRPVCAAFSPDSHFLAVGYSHSYSQHAGQLGIAHWYGRPGEWVFGDLIEEFLTAVAFSPTPSGDPDAAPDLWLAHANQLRRLRDWASPRLDTLTLTRTVDRRKKPRASRVAVSPTGEWVASNGRHGAAVWDGNGTAKFARSHTAKSPHNGPLAFAPDSGTLALAHGTKVTLWEFATDRPPLELVAHKQPVWGVAFSASGELVHTAGKDGTHRVFDRATGRQVRAMDFCLGGLMAMALAPDGLTMAAGTAGGRLVVWEIDD